MSEIDLKPQFKQQLESTLQQLNARLAGQDLSTARREILARDGRRIEAALERIEQGRYGLCCDCGEEMEGEWLAADPATPFCEDCQEDRMAA